MICGLIGTKIPGWDVPVELDTVPHNFPKRAYILETKQLEDSPWEVGTPVEIRGPDLIPTRDSDGDLRGAKVSARIREKMQSSSALAGGLPAGSMVRSVARDADCNESATADRPLTGDFQSMEFDVPGDYTQLVGGALDFDFSRIQRMRWEFSDMQTPAAAHSFDIDDVAIVPAPTSGVAQGVAAALLLLLSWARAYRS